MIFSAYSTTSYNQRGAEICEVNIVYNQYKTLSFMSFVNAQIFTEPDIEKRCSGGVITEVYTNVGQVREAVASQLLDSDIFKEVNIDN